MDDAARKLTPIDELYLQRAYELAARGLGNTLPNPPVGALIVRDGEVVGEGYHHRAGTAHAETNALRQAGPRARGATLYISLEPCRHVGRTPPCTGALIEAGVARVVAGTIDPKHGGGAHELREAGIDVAVADDARARALIEIFARASAAERPYLALKMAMSLDGFVASRAGVREQLGSAEEQQYVRDLRTLHDAVMVGAGTIRVDDPQLTVRPPHDRLRDYVRVVACASEAVPPTSRVFAAARGYARTIVLAPAGLRERFRALGHVADVIGVGDDTATALDLVQGMRELRARNVYSVLCEGGPTLAASLLATGQVDRFHWAIAPTLLGNERALPVLAGSGLDGRGVRLRFDRIERAGDDVIVSGTCSPD